MATRFVERIAVEVDGDGEAVLMIHGLGGTSNVWTPVLPALARHRTVRPDLPGSGRSDRVEGPLSVARFVEAMAARVPGAGVERAHVVGHSLGTIVASTWRWPSPRWCGASPCSGRCSARRTRPGRAARAGREQVRRDGRHAGGRRRPGAGLDVRRDAGAAAGRGGARARAR